MAKPAKDATQIARPIENVKPLQWEDGTVSKGRSASKAIVGNAEYFILKWRKHCSLSYKADREKDLPTDVGSYSTLERAKQAAEEHYGKQSQPANAPPAYVPRQKPDPQNDDEDRWPVHPANTAPKMSATELKVLAADIKKHGLHNPVVYWEDNREAAFGSKGPFQIYLLDGVNRARAIRLLTLDDHEVEHSAGLSKDGLAQTLCAFKRLWPSDNWVPDIDPYAFHLSMNVHRRHLTNEEKRWQIKQAIAANPQASNRKIGKKVGADHKTVAAARTEMTETVRNGEIPQTEHRPSARAEAALRDDPTLTTRQLQAKANVSADTATKARKQSQTKSEPKAEPVSEPKPDPEAKPDFRYFAEWIEGEAKHIMRADEWKGIVKHKAQMPAEYRDRVADCLKALVDQAIVLIAEFCAPP